jgi:hypothetical protein
MSKHMAEESYGKPRELCFKQDSHQRMSIATGPIRKIARSVYPFKWQRSLAHDDNDTRILWQF